MDKANLFNKLIYWLLVLLLFLLPFAVGGFLYIVYRQSPSVYPETSKVPEFNQQLFSQIWEKINNRKWTKEASSEPVDYQNLPYGVEDPFYRENSLLTEP